MIYQVDVLPDAYVKIHGTPFLTSESFPNVLGADEQIQFDLVIPNSRRLSGTIYIRFESADGTATRLRIYIRLLVRTPSLVFDPRSLSENVVRGTQRLINVQITNEGEVSAINVRPELPNDNRLSLVSFNVIRTNSSVESSNDVIEAGGVALMTLAVTIETTESLGEMTGRIVVHADDEVHVSFSLSYKFYITSLQTLNLTVRVEDEFTYFAEDLPLVVGAEVRLSNPRRGYSQTLYTTNETGKFLC